jgi:hypothetical protein
MCHFGAVAMSVRSYPTRANKCCLCSPGSRSQEITSALHGAMLLEWLVVVVAIALLLAGALGLWRGFLVRELVREQEQHRST